MKKKVVSVIVIALMMNGALCVPGLRAGTETPPSREVRLGVLNLLRDLADLKVTPEQRVAIRAVLKDHWPEIKPLLLKLNASRKEFRDTITATPPDEEGIRAAVYRRAAIMADLAVLRSRIGSEVRAVLNPEQIEGIEEIRKQIDVRLEALPARIEEMLQNERS